MKSYPIIFSALKFAFFQTKHPITTAITAKDMRVEVGVEGLEVIEESFGMLIKSARKNIDRAATQSRVGNSVG